jgi:hypothetical protein
VIILLALFERDADVTHVHSFVFLCFFRSVRFISVPSVAIIFLVVSSLDYPTRADLAVKYADSATSSGWSVRMGT